MKRTQVYKRIGYAGLLIACLAGGSIMSQAQPAPDQSRNIVSGVVEWVDTDKSAIVVGDSQFVLPSNVKGSGAVQKGRQIRIRFVWQGQQKVISEILN